MAKTKNQLMRDAVKNLNSMRRDLARQAMKDCEGDHMRAAKSLRVARSTLYRWLAK